MKTQISMTFPRHFPWFSMIFHDRGNPVENQARHLGGWVQEGRKTPPPPYDNKAEHLPPATSSRIHHIAPICS